MENRSSYCARHGYDFWARKHSSSELKRVQGERVKYWLESFPVCDWLFFMGTDTVITNPSIKLETIISIHPDADLIIGRDVNGINNDVFLARSCKATSDFFCLIRDCWEQFPHEQAAMEHHLFRTEMKPVVVDQRVMNSMPYWKYGYENDGGGSWKPGDFVFHAAGMPVQDKLTEMSLALTSSEAS